MRATNHGRMSTADPEFGAYVSAITQYSTPGAISGVAWYIAAVLGSDEWGQVPPLRASRT